MIPLAYITQWRQHAPWPDDLQVEQDLILSKIIVDIFSDPLLSKELAFRGGTALHKLFFSPALRYSEDIDLVRTGTGEIKPIIDKLHNCLTPWLGEPSTKRNNASFKLLYYFNPETSPTTKLRIKIEMNTRENFSVFGYSPKQFSVSSPWFSGTTLVNTYQFEELMATKLRALYQRKKGRDLFDIWLALKDENFDIPKMMHAFKQYMQKENNKITRIMFEKNIDEKLNNESFMDDITQLLPSNLKQSLSVPIGLEDSNDFLLFEDGKRMTTEGWSLSDAAIEVKDKLLCLLE